MVKDSKTSKEFQDIVLESLVKDDYLLSKVQPHISEEFFSSTDYKIIYKNLLYYKSMYNRLPTKSELLVVIKDLGNSSTVGVDIDQVIDRLYTAPKRSDEFIYSAVRQFIKRNNAEKTLSKIIPLLTDESTNVTIEDVGDELAKSMEFDLTRSSAFRLSDVDNLEDVRMDAVGSLDNPTIIKSVLPEVNNSLQFKGYKPGDVVMICLTGDTKIMTLDGKSHRIDDLYKMYQQGKKLGVYSQTIDNLKRRGYSIKPTEYESVVLTKYVTQIAKVTLDNGSVIRSTIDHKYLTDQGDYIEAQNLSVGTSLSRITRKYSQGRFIDKLEDEYIDSSMYEVVADSSGEYRYTHRLVGELIPHLPSDTHNHHIDEDKLNNNFYNIKRMTRSDHHRYHMSKNVKIYNQERLGRGEVLGRPIKKGEHLSRSTEIKKGQHLSRTTEFTSDRVIQYNKDLSIRRNQFRGKILKYLNHLCTIDNISLSSLEDIDRSKDTSTFSNYHKYSSQVVEKYFPEFNLKESVDFSKLISLALDYNHKVVKVEIINLDEPEPVYDLVNCGDNHNFFVDVGDNSGVCLKNCSPPGCFVGSTEVLLPNNTVKTLQDLYDYSTTNFQVINVDTSTHEVSNDIADSIYLSGYEDELISLTINGREIISTYDHPYLTPAGYRDAQFLTKGSKVIGLDDQGSVVEYEVESRVELSYPKKVPVYGIVDAGKHHNYIIHTGDNSGVVVSNTGKTMYMVNEGASASIQGFNVLHLFLGDMKEYDGFIRYTSRYLGVSQDDIVGLPLEAQVDLIRRNNFQQYFSRVVVSAYAAGELTIDQMIQEVQRLQDQYSMHFDMILVDYADNLKPESEAMYESGGVIYNKLSYLGFMNKSVIIVGSQPKPMYWDNEIIPKSGAAESSRKQHVIDVMITLGKPTDVGDGSRVATAYLAKVRRGTENIIRVKLDYSKANIYSIPESQYLEIKSGK